MISNQGRWAAGFVLICVMLYYLIYIFADSNAGKDLSFFDASLKEGDYPENCSAYLPLLKGIELDTENIAKNWRKAKWNLRQIKRQLLNKSLMKLKVENGTVHLIDDYIGFQTRNPSYFKLVNDSVHKFPIVPDCELYVYTGDIHRAVHAPHFSATKFPDELKFLVPDFSFNHWKEARIPEWPVIQEKLREARKLHPFSKRIAKAFWRGAVTGFTRSLLVKISENNPEVVDAKFMDWNDNMQYVSLPDHCQYKYLVHTDGNSYSARLKYLMGCGSIVLYQEQDFPEFWSHLLEDGVNMIRVKRDYSDLVKKMEDLQHMDAIQLEKIGKNAAKLFDEQLSLDAIHCYWATALKRYATLLMI